MHWQVWSSSHSYASKITSALRRSSPLQTSTSTTTHTPYVHVYVLRNLAASRYYALSAAGALFKHSESRLNTRFATGSLKIRYAPVEGTLMIDMETARNLELVGNAVHRKSGHSLFGWVVPSDVMRDDGLLMQPDRVLNHTYTSMATRLLRANILAPLTGRVCPSRSSIMYICSSLQLKALSMRV